jgi:hypothetical protein
MTTQYLTSDDVNSFGPELISVTQRAALEAVSPHLQNLQQQNAQLQQRLAVEARRNLDQRVERAVPNFREIDRQPAWHRYLSGVDELSGRVRQTLLNDAIASGSEARIAAFFRSFQSQQAGNTQAPASTGTTSRPTPFSTSRSSSLGTRVYSREDIGRLYEKRRKGGYTDDTWNRIEADIFQAQRDGRVVDHPYITK